MGPEQKKIYTQRCQGLNNQDELLVGDCAFDQCIAEQSDDTTLPRKWLDATQNMFNEIHQQNMDTEGSKDCVAPWVSYKNLGCFQIVQQKKNWNDARNYCQQQGGDLAILDLKPKRIDMINYLEESKSRKTNYWLGSKDDSGAWVWLNKLPATDGWYPGEPSNKDGGNCMYLSNAVTHTDYKVLYVIDCSYDLAFI